MRHTENVDHAFQMQNQTKINEGRLKQNCYKSKQMTEEGLKRTNPWKSRCTNNS